MYGKVIDHTLHSIGTETPTVDQATNPHVNQMKYDTPICFLN